MPKDLIIAICLSLFIAAPLAAVGWYTVQPAIKQRVVDRLVAFFHAPLVYSQAVFEDVDRAAPELVGLLGVAKKALAAMPLGSPTARMTTR